MIVIVAHGTTVPLPGTHTSVKRVDPILAQRLRRYDLRVNTRERNA